MTARKLQFTNNTKIETVDPELHGLGIRDDDEIELVGEGIDFEYLSCANIFEFRKAKESGVWFLYPQPATHELRIIYPDNYNPYLFQKRTGIARKARDWIQKRKTKVDP